MKDTKIRYKTSVKPGPYGSWTGTVHPEGFKPFSEIGFSTPEEAADYCDGAVRNCEIELIMMAYEGYGPLHPLEEGVG